MLNEIVLSNRRSVIEKIEPHWNEVADNALIFHFLVSSSLGFDHFIAQNNRSIEDLKFSPTDRSFSRFDYHIFILISRSLYVNWTTHASSSSSRYSFEKLSTWMNTEIARRFRLFDSLYHRGRSIIKVESVFEWSMRSSASCRKGSWQRTSFLIILSNSWYNVITSPSTIFLRNNADKFRRFVRIDRDELCRTFFPYQHR